ncbi:MAG: SIS domain-containing protein [Oscillospiraceae bacterium]
MPARRRCASNWSESGRRIGFWLFSFPRYSASTGRGACFGRSRGATVVGITDNRESPVGQCADLVLCAKSDMLSMVGLLWRPLSAW